MLPGQNAIGAAPLGAAVASTATPAASQGFDPTPTIISQYANSSVINNLINYFSQWFGAQTLFDLFYTNIWNIDTASGYGLDVLGRIVGAKRVINVPASGVYIGFAGQSTAQNWGNGLWYNGAVATNNIALTDDVFRRVIKAKALSNIWDGSISGANAILMTLFPNYGNCYTIDNGNMSITYKFGATLTPVDYALANQEGILPRPSGVSITIA